MDKDSSLAEYQAAHNSFHHYDAFRWSSGSLLIAGSLVLWGFVISTQSTDPKVIGVTSLLISVLLSVWMMFAHHYRQLYMTKLHRIHEIESFFGMHLNRRLGFLGVGDKTYCMFGPKGHDLDIVIYVTISLFGPVLALLTTDFSWWFFISVPVLIACIFYVDRNERQMQEMLKKLALPNPTTAKPADGIPK